jgi:MFS family permease
MTRASALPDRLPVAPILALGVTQIIGYGTLYYSFSILAPDVAAHFSWPIEWIFGALSVALLIGGLTAPWLGEMFDRAGAGPVMTVGSAIAAAALAACALSPAAVVYVVALTVMQIAANLVQYGAAFALLVQLRPQTAARSITYLTLIAGFASTIFWPITAWLHAHLSWQNIYLVFAAMNLFVCLPLHAWLARGARKGRVGGHADAPRLSPTLPQEHRRLGFLLMVTGFSLISVSCAAVLVHMVPLLTGLGLGSSAALVGALFGPAQVASRVINMAAGRNFPALKLSMVSAMLIAIGIFILPVSAPSAIGAMAFAILFGMGNGLLSIASGSLPLQLFGSEGYGRLQGRMMSARLVLSAVAPFLLAISMTRLGIVPSLTVIAALGGLATASFVAIGWIARTGK